MDARACFIGLLYEAIYRAEYRCCGCYTFDDQGDKIPAMVKEKLSDNAQEWVDVINMSPAVWAEEGILSDALERDGVGQNEQEYLIKVLQSLL